MTTKKKIILAIAILAGLIALSQDGIFNALMGFLLVGAIPGTHVAVPFWAMVAFWCLVIAAVATAYIETIIRLFRSQKLMSDRRARMPKRRFSNI